jgi:hypothetical protein
MTMSPRLSKFVFTSHITFSVGWLGAVAVFIALAITGIVTKNIQLARAAYLAMEVSSCFVIVPFCIASLLTGIIQSLGTKWGIFKYYWIVVKLILTLAATVLLLLHRKPISLMAGIAAESKFSITEQPGLRIRLIADAGAGFLVILAILTLSVYKPWGKIPNILQQKSKQGTQNMGKAHKKSLGKYILIGLGGLILVFIILHLSGRGMHGMHSH